MPRDPDDATATNDDVKMSEETRRELQERSDRELAARGEDEEGTSDSSRQFSGPSRTGSMDPAGRDKGST